MSQFDESFDWIAVGTGGASMCSSLYMVAQGKRVLMLEKTDRVGGSTARSGGVMWIPNNPFLKRDGVEDSHDMASTYLEGLAAEHGDTPGSTYERRQTYLRESLNMLSFLQQQGIPLDRAAPWPDYYDERPGGLTEGRCVVADTFNLKELGEWRGKLREGFLPAPARLTEAMDVGLAKVSWSARFTVLKIGVRLIGSLLMGKRVTSAGAALQGRQLQAILRHGADIRTETAVKELIMEDNRIVGVLIDKDGKPWRIRAELGVLVGAGGFARNQQMREQYQPHTSSEWSSTSPGDTGEMIQEMQRHGAALAQMDEMVGNQCLMPPESKYEDIKQTAQSVTAKPHAILVDQTGVRYMNEGGSYMSFCKAMITRHGSNPAVPSWAILDSQYIEKYMLAGKGPGKRKPKNWFEQGFLKQADSIQALAKMIDVDPQTLQNSVQRFNGFVDNNRDEDFQRGERAYDNWLGDPTHQPSATLGRIDRAPFYAAAVYPGDVGTFGGAVTDASARVLREDNSVIEGLYAAGVSSASVMGRVYPGAGSSVGPALTFGYVAAKHALQQTP